MDARDGEKKDLKLCGEHINLVNRTRFTEDTKKLNGVKFRPKSALYSSNKNVPEYNRRPFSAGTEPTSPKLHSFLRHVQPNSDFPKFATNKNSEFFRDFVSIPGTVESSLLCDKLINDPIVEIDQYSEFRKNRFSYDLSPRNDNISENGSEDTCVSLGTKIKVKAQCADKLLDNYEIDRNNILNKKLRGQINWSARKSEDIKSLTPAERDISDISIKLQYSSINNKEENTSSGVSSSSDINCVGTNESKKNKEDSTKVNKSKKGQSSSTEWLPSSVSENIKIDAEKKVDSLAGRVSFGKPSHYEQPLLSKDFSEHYLPFNSPLSLVEEESSQDSDTSSKYMSLNFKTIKKDSIDGKYIGSYERDSKMNCKNDLYQLKNENYDETELKYKALEEKYKNEILELRMSTSKPYSSSTVKNNDFGSTSKLNEIKNDKIDRESYNNYHQNSSSGDIFNVPVTTKENSRDLPVSNMNSLNFDNVKMNKNSPEVELKNDDSHSESITVPKILINGQDTSSDDNKNGNDKHDTSPTIDYPLYLEKNQSKTYTTKVIEEYKKEINAINNFHDLTIKDLRKKCDDLKPYTNSPSPKHTNNKCRISSSDDCDEEEIDETFESNYRASKPLLNNKQTRKNDVLINHKNEGAQIVPSVKTDTDSTVKYKAKTLKPKMKKKIKKKEPISNKIECKQGTLRRNVYDGKRNLNDVNSNGKKGVVKFKAQKITFSKSTTKINHTMYMNNDRDIVSWMATRVDTPFDDNSSNDNLEKTINREHHHSRNSVHFEDDIVPVINEHSELPDMSNDCNDLESYENIEDESFPTTPVTTKAYESFNFDKYLLPDDNNEDDKLDYNNFLKNETVINTGHTDVDILVEGSNNTVVRKSVEEANDHMTAEYDDIINFLEKVEKSANEDNLALSHNQAPFALKVEELMDLSKGELAHRVVVGALAASKAATSAAGFRATLLKAAKTYAARLKAIKATSKHQAASASAQAAHTIQRHQKFIEQLVDEKKALTDRIEQLAGTAAGAEARRARAERTAAERLQLELRNQRQRLTTAHQRDKQAWLKHHTQKIKEMTVKGLETELHEIEKSHAEQLIKYQQQGETSIIDLKEQHGKEIRKIKDEAARHLEDQLDKERLMFAERLEQKRLEWESAIESAAERADKEAREAARRSEEMIKNTRLQAEMWKAEQEKEIGQKIKAMEKQMDNKKALMMEEMSQLREKMMNDFDCYKDEYIKKQAVFLKEKEMEIKALVRRERDREIEKAIDCMEMEAQEGRKETQDAIRRIKEKYENDIRLLEENEKTTLQKCKELRDQVRDVQELHTVNQITITQLEGKLKQCNEMKIQNEAQTNILVRAAEAKGQDAVEDLKVQLQNLKQQHKEEMHQLFAKVKVVVARKDDAVILAKREVANLRERCMKLEARFTPR